jgi:hypothetical protein
MKTPEKRRAWLKEYRQRDKYKLRMRKYRKQWMKSPAGKMSRKNHHAKRRALIAAHKIECADCGETDKSILDFHHLDPSKKDTEISKLTSLKKTAEEIAKCVVVCKDCHKKRHGIKVKAKCPCCGTLVAEDRILRVN